MRSKQQLDKTLKITFASLSRKSDEKEKRKKTRMATAKLFAFHANAIIHLDLLEATENTFVCLNLEAHPRKKIPIPVRKSRNEN